MGTWIDLHGSIGTEDQAVLEAFNDEMSAESVYVDDTGFFSYDDACGWGFYERITTMFTELCTKFEVGGKMHIRFEDGDETWVYGGTDMQKSRLAHMHLYEEMLNAKHNYEQFILHMDQDLIKKWEDEFNG